MTQERRFRPALPPEEAFPALGGQDVADRLADRSLAGIAAEIIQPQAVADGLEELAVRSARGAGSGFLRPPAAVRTLALQDPDALGVFFEGAVFPLGRHGQDVLFEPVEDRQRSPGQEKFDRPCRFFLEERGAPGAEDGLFPEPGGRGRSAHGVTPRLAGP